MAGRLKISSSVAPTISIDRDRRIGIVKLSNLKKIRIANKVGIVIARPPNDGVIPSCRALLGLSWSFPNLLLLGIYVILFLRAI